MTQSQKLHPGARFPDITLPRLGGGTLTLAQPESGHDWRMIVVYRGKHCPICTRYLRELNDAVPDLNQLGVDLVAVSADPVEKVEEQMAQVQPAYAVGHDLTPDQMQTLGLYVSDPRSPQETDRPFAEPAIFVVNAEGNLQIVDIANAPFLRPDLKLLIGGIRFIRDPENNYPIRGTHL